MNNGIDTPGPFHVGIILDANGRWATQRGRRRNVGHRVGAEAVRRTTEAAARMGLRQLTFFVFSSENWKRPPEEVDFLMRLFRRFLRAEADGMRRNDIRFRVIGRIHELPGRLADEIALAESTTRSCRGMTLCLAMNYGGRNEILDACRRLVKSAACREINADDIDEHVFTDRLYQPDMPPLDLIIRTGGEMRLSNFLLWQAAYAEFYATPVCGPDFGEEHLMQAIADFRRRTRRFGALEGAAAKSGSPSFAAEKETFSADRCADRQAAPRGI
jgi:undecaprenyl diphosphate synthase